MKPKSGTQAAVKTKKIKHSKTTYSKIDNLIHVEGV